MEALATAIDALVASQTDEEATEANVRYWRQQLERVPLPANSRKAKCVLRCRQMAFESFIREAAALGWTERDLFGWGGPNVKAGHGLVVGLALMTKKPNRVVEITADYAVIKSDGGVRIQVPRGSEHPPIWT